MYFHDCNYNSNIKNTEQYSVVQWHTQAVNITTNLTVKIDFILHEFRMTKIMRWDFHVNNSDNSRYDMILGRDMLTALVLNIHIS